MISPNIESRAYGLLRSRGRSTHAVVIGVEKNGQTMHTNREVIYEKNLHFALRVQCNVLNDDKW